MLEAIIPCNKNVFHSSFVRAWKQGRTRRSDDDFFTRLGLAKKFNVSIKLFYGYSSELQKDYLPLNRFDLSLNLMRITLNCQCDWPIKMFVQRIT